jgi:hypothetical protein
MLTVVQVEEELKMRHQEAEAAAVHQVMAFRLVVQAVQVAYTVQVVVKDHLLLVFKVGAVMVHKAA